MNSLDMEPSQASNKLCSRFGTMWMRMFAFFRSCSEACRMSVLIAQLNPALSSFLVWEANSSQVQIHGETARHQHEHARDPRGLARRSCWRIQIARRNSLPRRQLYRQVRRAREVPLLNLGLFLSPLGPCVSVVGRGDSCSSIRHLDRFKIIRLVHSSS